MPLAAQMHKVAKPEQVVRAVGVYEWTGDMAKPTASRLVPVSLFINGSFEDAGIYLARPVPFSLDEGNIYEVDQAGVPKGTVTLSLARRFEPSDTSNVTPFDDGWFGYGRFAPPAPPKKSTLRPSRTLAVIHSDDDDDPTRPHFSSKSAQPGTGGAATPVPGSSTTSDTPLDDPDRPTLHRGTEGSDQSASSSGGSGSGNSSDSPIDDDPDRPTLKRRSPENAKKSKEESQQQDAVTSTASLNDDPNRPIIHRGRPMGMPAEEDLPKLTGLPGDADLHQMVAVSDAVDRPVHNFSLAWQNDAQHQAVLAQMQAAAREQLKAYEEANGLVPKPAPAPSPDSRHPNSKLRHAVTPDSAPPPAPPEPLLDEQLKAYMLSYGGSPTYVYTAHTSGLGPALCFVTLVAQVDVEGTPQVVLKSVTDAAHLDRTPRMKFVDVVDADASNRASLLFELRGQNERQFALYRVLGGRADQVFLTGTTQ